MLGATMGDWFIHGSGVSTKVAASEGVNWKELWVLEGALTQRPSFVGGKLVPTRQYNSAAAAYANHGPGRSPPLTRSVRRIKELE